MRLLTLMKYELQSVAQGTTFAEISTSKFASLKVVIPSLAEQQKIADFVNYADRRFNRLIRSKRRLIGLLNEQKQAIIHHAVTRAYSGESER